MKLTRRVFMKLFGKTALIPVVPTIIVGCGGGGGGGGSKKELTTPAVQNAEDGTWIRFIDM